MTGSRQPRSCSQRGAAATEFALVSILFLSLVFAVIELAWVMFAYVSAVEATRLGARLAAVCNVTDAGKIKNRMQGRLGILRPSNISITYPAAGCSAASCDPITVRIQNLTVPTAIPLIPVSFPLPDFVTSVPAESLDSTGNPVCN